MPKQWKKFQAAGAAASKGSKRPWATEILRKSGLLDSGTQRATRFRQLDHEESEANKLRAEGFEVFSPTTVCDRVAVKDGKVFFVEFKQPGQKLRPGQQRIHDLIPEMYMIRFSDR